MSTDYSSKGAETQASPSRDAPKRDDPGIGGDAEVTSKRKAESPPLARSEDSIQKRQKKGISETDSSRMSQDAESAVSAGQMRTSPKERTDRKSHSSKANSPDEPRRRSAQTPPDRRKNLAQEERKRGQRLFGGLLSTLNQRQTGPNSQQKKRLDADRRQQERANNQRIEDDKRREERLAKLKHSRQIQQITFDEQVMRTRHATMLSQAKSLRTRSKPEIYYRPWEPSLAQERLILEQVKDAEDAIADELEQFKIRKAKRLADLGVALPKAPRDEPIDEPPADKTVGELADEKSNPTDADKSTKVEDDKAQHDDKEVVVETEEDTVIY